MPGAHIVDVRPLGERREYTEAEFQKQLELCRADNARVYDAARAKLTKAPGSKPKKAMKR